mmetsp:Transcript_17143/g.48901  ORF Transcript_17143/g.48901 Transcript_17143/m.48901 type:complete len:296 (+) Transcript_17143:193-1080(+)
MALAGRATHSSCTKIAAVIHVAAVPQVRNNVGGPAVGRPDERRVPRGVGKRDVGAGLEAGQVPSNRRLPRVRTRRRDVVLLKRARLRELEALVEAGGQGRDVLHYHGSAFVGATFYKPSSGVDERRRHARFLPEDHVVRRRVPDHHNLGRISDLPRLQNGLERRGMRLGRVGVIPRNRGRKGRQALPERRVEVVDCCACVARHEGRGNALPRQPLGELPRARRQLQGPAPFLLHLLDDRRGCCGLGVGHRRDGLENVLVLRDAAALVHDLEIQVRHRERAVQVEDDASQRAPCCR